MELVKSLNDFKNQEKVDRKNSDYPYQVGDIVYLPDCTVNSKG